MDRWTSRKIPVQARRHLLSRWRSTGLAGRIAAVGTVIVVMTVSLTLFTTFPFGAPDPPVCLTEDGTLVASILGDYSNRWNELVLADPEMRQEQRQVRNELATHSLPTCGDRARQLAVEYMDLALEAEQVASEEGRDARQERLQSLLNEYLVEGAAIQGTRIPRVLQ